MTVQQIDCLILGPKAQPVPIPTIKECGVICVPINSTDHWLNKIAGNRCQGEPQLVVKEFVDEILKALAAPIDGEAETTERSLGVEEGAPAQETHGAQGARCHGPRQRF